MDDLTSPRKAARNLELKVSCDEADLWRVRDRLLAAGATTIRHRQIDTYFAVPRGRLKLREIAGANPNDRAAELIGYDRPDTAGPRWSAYHRIAVAPGDAAILKNALTATVSVRVVVAKEREVGVLSRTRVHLDRVEGLGCFVELETVVGPDEDGAGADVELSQVTALLGLDRLEPVAGSYADLADPR